MHGNHNKHIKIPGLGTWRPHTSPLLFQNIEVRILSTKFTCHTVSIYIWADSLHSFYSQYASCWQHKWFPTHLPTIIYKITVNSMAQLCFISAPSFLNFRCSSLPAGSVSVTAEDSLNQKPYGCRALSPQRPPAGAVHWATLEDAFRSPKELLWPLCYHSAMACAAISSLCGRQHSQSLLRVTKVLFWLLPLCVLLPCLQNDPLVGTLQGN